MKSYNIHLTFVFDHGKIPSYLLLITFVLLSFQGFAQNENAPSISYYLDNTISETLTSVQSKKFTALVTDQLSVGLTKSRVWIKIKTTKSNEKDRVIALDNSNIDELQFYSSDAVVTTGLIHSFSGKKHKINAYLFPISKEAETYYIKITSKKPVVSKISISTLKKELDKSHLTDILFSIYFGIIAVMLLYNLIIFFFLKETLYLYYILMLFFISLTQFNLFGYDQRILWGDHVWLSTNAYLLVGILSGATTLSFAQKINNLKRHTPKLNKLFSFYHLLYLLAFTLAIMGNHRVSQAIIDFIAINVFLLLYAGYLAYKKGNQSSKYYLIATTFFFAAIVIFILKSSGVIPSNMYTSFALPFGSALEVILLSLALANRINILKKEKQLATAQSLKQLALNQTLIETQKNSLEIEVRERTKELEQAYKELEQTQRSRIEAEKMSSLGQLTAGIAHELNNPINFISNNVSPLRRDFGEILTLVDKYELCLDNSVNTEAHKALHEYKEEIELDFLKKEIEILLAGIKEGSNRTAEIVQNLKIYSHLDSGEMRMASIVPGLRSTIVIMQSNFKTDCKITTDIPNDIAEIYCLPGKLNQVFMNILNNAIHASMEKNKLYNDRIVSVTVREDQQNLYIKIADNGNGIPKAVKEKIFDPFYTTKKIGLGTGLGLSISKTIVENHQGEIKINTFIGKGTEIVVVLPREFKKK